MYCLHQMSERLYYCYLLVFTHYKPRSHDLHVLRDAVAVIDKHIETLFPLTTEEEKDQHLFLSDAYVNSRYQMHYSVEREQVDVFIEQVAAFQAWVLTENLRFIDSLDSEQVFSDSYLPEGALLDLATVKNQDTPKAVIESQLEALRVMEKRLTEAEGREEFEREEKEAGLEREEVLKQKLRDAGLEP